MTTSNIIKETENYILCVGESVEETGRAVYKIINTQHDVVELETSILPEALSHMDSIQDALREQKIKEGTSSSDNVVSLT